MRKLIVILAITLMTYSCATSVELHIPLYDQIPPNCIFTKFTDEEKIGMGKSGVDRVFNNQQDCRDRQIRIMKLIKKHDDKHKPE